MKNNLRKNALQRTVQTMRLVSDTQIQERSTLSCGVVLQALPSTRLLAPVRKRIAHNLEMRLTIPWIAAGPPDEVFCALAALWSYDATYITGDKLACAVKRLIAAEVEAGGPYRFGKDVSVGANTQVAIFMRQLEQPLPNVHTFLRKATRMRRLDNNQCTQLGSLYFLAKATERPALSRIDTIVADICTRPPDSKYRPHISLLRAVSDDDTLFMTTALMIESLSDHAVKIANVPRQELSQRQGTIANRASGMLSGYAEPLRSSGLSAVSQVCGADNNFEITLLPEFFAQSLETPAPVTKEMCRMLGLANLWVWVAYTIYDDFLDMEGEPALLPVANVAMRLSLECFRAALPAEEDFYHYVAGVFARMDEANAWEVDQCRFAVDAEKVVIPTLPEYGGGGVLAERAFAHVLAPMAILMQHAPGNKRQLRRIEAAFRHYLIARQLNDDLHDWFKDMKAGQASYVVTAILRDMRIRPGTYSAELLLTAMQRRFRDTTMPKVCQDALHHIQESRHNFKTSKLFSNRNHIYTLLDVLEASIVLSLDTHHKARTFTHGASSDAARTGS